MTDQSPIHRLGVVNVVCTMNVGRGIDLALACMATHGKLSMSAFPAHVSKCKYPPSTNCAFESGQLVNTGSVNAQSALLGATLYVDRISRDLGYELSIINFQVENIVAAVNIGFSLNLALLLDDGKELHDRKWEASLFPGLKLESSESDVVFIIFQTGNVIATGMQHIERVATAEQLLHELHLERYKVGHEYRQLDSQHQPCVTRGKDTTHVSKRQKKPNQFKVINHTKKKAAFQASLVTSNKPHASRGTGLTSSAPNRKRKHASSTG